jgi:ubiquitin carboxyl-terminal hydrolase 47
MKPELLNGDNQYACQPCNKKVDAEKGIKIEKVPEVISVILNRFAFDYVKF